MQFLMFVRRLREADGAGKVLQLEFNGVYYLCELSILVGEGGRPRQWQQDHAFRVCFMQAGYCSA